ncbi:unnamed protein product [Lathyrus sativus]|nr:unnamed protein product [Lathyrus sativus]
MGGRVSLINSVIANLPIHHLAFFKAPKKVVNEIIAIQHRFLWAGNSSKKFISWISWNSVCKPKDHGGLGIKHVGRFNCALIAKWLWRFQSGGNEIWRKTLTLRYGNLSIKLKNFIDVGSLKSDSIWLKDIMSSCIYDPHMDFCKFTTCSVGEGHGAAFWKSNWIGYLPLKSIFQQLFQGCSKKASTVSEMGAWEDGQWVWKIRENVIDAGSPIEPEWTDYRNMLEHVSVNNNESDNWKWLLDNSMSYKVISFYSALTSSSSVHDIGNDTATLLEILWKTVLLAKVQTLVGGWRLIGCLLDLI